ncbi:hypothetical protein DH2020_006628 [Rehmannia glutinosa]|uniref:Uncharacterized protein n=1 Tax=Rehmannia glutinosa TaxID=99300 RepID=A0ABR0XJE8_REHGL
MSLDSPDSSNPRDLKSEDIKMSTPVESAPDNSERDVPSKFSASGISTWAKNLKIPQPFVGSQDASPSGDSGKSPFSRFTSGIGLRSSPKSPQSEGSSAGASPTAQSGIIGTITKGLVDSSKNAVKAVQVKARHVVSQNKRRYQDGGFDLDMTYITENIIAMGFPAGDMSSGFFGYVEVASFPFDDHNCPPIQLIISFCQSAYSWLKEDIENVVVVHCKAGMARTGLMISSLLLYLKFFPTAEESIDYYNQKRCIDGKGLVLPSQIPEDFWFSAPKKGIMVFALPGEPGLTELAGDFKVHFHDRQGDFYCWLNTTMIENRKVLNTSDLDGFDKGKAILRKLPSPGFQIEVVLVDYDAASAPLARPPSETTANESAENPGANTASRPNPAPTDEAKNSKKEKDDEFSDSDADEKNASSKSKQTEISSQVAGTVTTNDANVDSHQIANLTRKAEQVSLGSSGSTNTELKKDAVGGTSGTEGEVSEFKAMAADASVFSFGDDEDYESE